MHSKSRCYLAAFTALSLTRARACRCLSTSPGENPDLDRHRRNRRRLLSSWAADLLP